MNIRITIIKTIKTVVIFSLVSLASLSLWGCSSSGVTPPLEFTPSPQIIEKAIVMQLEQKYDRVTKKLDTKKPKYKITNIKVNKIEPTIKFSLPTYHLEGKYKLTIKNDRKKSKKVTSSFQIDLQRQSAGQTWRLIIPQKYHQTIRYYSYKIS